VIYKTKLAKGPNRNFQVYDQLDLLAAVTAHIPDRREHLVRYSDGIPESRGGRGGNRGLKRSLLKRKLPYLR
jgi:hypothetical protein